MSARLPVTYHVHVGADTVVACIFFIVYFIQISFVKFIIAVVIGRTNKKKTSKVQAFAV